jgi:hypothetical protein
MTSRKERIRPVAIIYQVKSIQDRENYKMAKAWGRSACNVFEKKKRS